MDMTAIEKKILELETKKYRLMREIRRLKRESVEVNSVKVERFRLNALKLSVLSRDYSDKEKQLRWQRICVCCSRDQLEEYATKLINDLKEAVKNADELVEMIEED